MAGIDSAAVESFRARFADQVSPATVNRHLVLPKATFNRAMRAGKCESNPVKGLKLLKENNIRMRCLTPGEEDRLLAVLPEYLCPFVLVALNTGMRWSELSALRWDDVDFHTGTLTIRRSKSGEGRRIPMNSAVRDALRAYAESARSWGRWYSRHLRVASCPISDGHGVRH